MMGIRLPNITSQTTAGQVEQIKSFLHQLVQQLNHEMATVSAQANEKAVQKSGASVRKAGDVTEATFNQVKSLIIKSADIVDAYYEKINHKLEGIYVAQSDFGAFSEETALEIAATSQHISQHYSDIQQILSEMAEIQSTLLATSANIRTGLLFYVGEDGSESTEELPNGTPVFGVEIGQTVTQDGTEVFNKFSRFTAYGLIFYDENGVEAAYISDRKLRIPHAKIESTLTEGGYEDEISADGSVVTRWVGV